MARKHGKPVDKIVSINGIKYVVRYIDGVVVGKILYTDFVKYAKITG